VSRLLLVPVIALGVACAALADDHGSSGRAFWCVPTVETVPEPADLLSTDAWPQASAFTAFGDLQSGLLSRSQPVFWVAQDEAELLVGWRVPKLQGRPLVKQTAERDGPLWDDDSVEIFLDPGHTHSDYYQFMVNAMGTQTDARAKDLAWNGKWEARVAEGPDAWAGLARIPFSTLQVAPPLEGAVWTANFGVDRSPEQRPTDGWEHEGPNLTWSRLGPGTTFHEPANLGHLLFRARDRVQLTSLGEPWRRELRVTGSSTSPVAVELRGPDGDPAWKAEAPAGRYAMYPSEMPEGQYVLAITARGEAEHIALVPARFRAVGTVDGRLSTLALARELVVDARLEAPQPPVESILAARLLDGAGKTVREGHLEMRGGVSSEPLRWSFADLPPARYRVVVFEPERPQSRCFVDRTLPEAPEWLGSDAGKLGDDVVLQPWTPLQVLSRSPLRIACWGREYGFSGGLIDSVQALQEPLLAGPMTWEAETAGGAARLSAQAGHLTKVASGAVEFTGAQAAEGLRIACRGRMEFDGFVKLRLRVEARPGTDLQALTLSIPFRADIARLMHHFPRPSVWVKVDPNKLNARAVPEEGWASPFVYHVWVGDEEKGLQWLCETEENWRPADPNRAIELVPEGERTVLKLNLIGQSTKLDRPLDYVFAFQAGPVKPTPGDYRHWRYAQVGSYGIQSAPYTPKGPDRSVTYPAEGNIDPQQGTLEISLTPTFDSTAVGELNRGLFDLLWPADTRVEPERLVAFYWNQDDRGMRVVYREHDAYRCIAGSPYAWKPGEPHTVAFTWGQDAAVYVDGQRQIPLPSTPLFLDPVDLQQAVLRIGGMESDFILHQVRISDVIRAPGELGSGVEPLPADEHTLLLDRFDSLTGTGPERVSHPQRVAGDGAGQVTVAARQVAGGLDVSRSPFRGTVLDYYKSLNLKYLGFHEHWSDWQGFPRTSHTEELKSLLAACHEKDLKLILYHSWQLADIAPEYPLYLSECEIIHPERFIYTRQPPQKDYPICPRSAWADFMADGLQKLFSDFGPDGIYSDGLSYPAECSNALHGCGWVDEAGRRHPTLSLFATREAMKRFRHILQQQNKDTLFVCHTSGAITLPTLAFCDAYLDGEHMCGLPRPLRVPLDAFRAEFMGHNFGIPAYFLVYDWHGGMTTPEGLALSLLHDTELPWSFEAMAPVRRVWDEFGVDGAEFSGYWRNGTWLQQAPAGVEVSAYLEPNGEKLLVAVNVTEEPVAGAIRLSTPVAEARDTLQDEAMEVEGGAIVGQFAPWSLRLIRVR